MASGGYTGDWGDSSGRWALLHTKELVLNKEDTENILNAVDMVRGFSSVLDGNVGAMSTRLGTFRLGANSFGNTVEQMVTIEANFPSVTQSKEIEDAFNSLVNAAAQYSNRKNI